MSNKLSLTFGEIFCCMCKFATGLVLKCCKILLLFVSHINFCNNVDSDKYNITEHIENGVSLQKMNTS